MWWSLLLLPASLALHSFEPTPPIVSNREDDVTVGYFNVRLNHFDASNTDTFPMRYYYNRGLMNNFPTNDVVIFVGGEWSISPGWVQGGLPYELADELDAGLFYTEHRYYGQTRPSNDTSVHDLRFLTVDQALADLAQFIQIIKSPNFENGRFREGRVVLIGCSYAGSMATWMQLAYPHLVDAAYSDSGPLHAQEDFPEYLQMITTALREQGSEECVTAVNEAIVALQTLLDTNPASASTMFNTCTQIQTGSQLDRSTFFWFGITETFAYLVQYATPGDIPAVCNALTDSSTQADPLQRLATWVTSQPWTQPCIETRYTEVVAQHTDLSYDAPQSVMRLWTYQTCVEFGWYQTTTSQMQPFLDTIPLEYFHQMCKDFFSIDFDEARLRAGIFRTNTFFAGLTHLPDHVVSVAGGHDPWSPMGPHAGHQTPLAPVYVVPQTSHCRALGSLGSTNEPELEAVKRSVFNHLNEWVNGVPASNGNNLVAPLALVFATLALLV